MGELVTHLTSGGVQVVETALLIGLLQGSNLTNSDAAQVISSGQYIESEVPLRPRVVTLQVGMKF